MKYETKKLPDSMLEVRFTVDSADFAKHEEKAWQKLSQHIEIDGFRKGKVPKDVAIKQIGQMVLVENMAEAAIAEAYREFLVKENADVIGKPMITITKIGIGSDLEFTLTTALMPVVDLPDYAKISKSVKMDDIAEATEEEVDSLIKELRIARAREDNRIANHGNPEGIKNDFTEEELPAFTDEVVKTFGDFESIADFRTKMRDRMTEDKKGKAKDKRRMKILESILEKTTADVPKVLIDYELDKMLARLEQDIMYSGMKMDDYLKNLEKTREEVKLEWVDDAKKRALSILALDAISKKESITPDEDAVNKELELLQKMYKDVDPTRGREYIVEIMTQSKVLEFLENIQ